MKNSICMILLLLTVQFGWSQKIEILPGLIEKVETVSNELHIDDPNPMNPLALNATIVWSDDRTQLAIVMKAILLEQWHIYAYVPDTQPYIESEVRLELPDGIVPIKDWEEPNSIPYDDGIYIYEDECIFVQYCSVNSFKKGDKIISELYYQTCDIHKCFPPETKTISMTLE